MSNYLKLTPNKNLIKLNAVKNIQKDKISFFFNKTNFDQIKLSRIYFQFKYNLINILLKIFRILNNFIFSKEFKATQYLQSYLFNNYQNQTLFLNNIWNNQTFLSKNSFKKYFYYILPAISNKNYKHSKILHKSEISFKYFLKRKKWIFFKKNKKFNYIFEYFNIRRKWKLKNPNCIIRYSKKKNRKMITKASYYYRYPAKAWSFFKWSKLISNLKPIFFNKKFKKNFSYKYFFFNLNSFFKENNLNVTKKLKYKKIMNPLLNKKMLLYKTFNYNKRKRKKHRYYRLLKNKYLFNKNTFCLNSLYRSSFKYKFFFKYKYNKPWKKIKKLNFKKKNTYKYYFSYPKHYKMFLIGFNFNRLKKINFNLNKNILWFNGYTFNKFRAKDYLNYYYLYKNNLYFLLSKLNTELLYFKKKQIFLLNYCSITKTNFHNLYKKFIICLLVAKFLKFESSNYKYFFFGQTKLKKYKQRMFNFYCTHINFNSQVKFVKPKFFLNYSKNQNIKYTNNLLFLY